MWCGIIMTCLILLLCFHKYVLAVISILLGNKEVLSEFGNFCEEKTPYHDSHWSLAEKHKPGDPEPDLPVTTFKWKPLEDNNVR